MEAVPKAIADYCDEKNEFLAKTNFSSDIKKCEPNPVRRRWLKCKLPDYFPEVEVVDGYLQPNVLKFEMYEKSPFKWGEVNVQAIIEHTKKYLPGKVEETRSTLDIIMKRKSEYSKLKQNSIENYFSKARGGSALDSISAPSKRIRNAAAHILVKRSNKVKEEVSHKKIKLSPEKP